VVLVFSSFLAPLALATRYNVYGQHDSKSYYGTRGYKRIYDLDVVDESIVNGFVCIASSSDQFMCVGYYQGLNPDDDWYDEPRYYWDRKLRGVYDFDDVGAASENTNHEFRVELHSNGYMLAYVDSSCKKSESGYSYIAHYSSGQGESDNIQNEMYYHFWDMKKCNQYITWSSFTDTDFGKYPTSGNPYSWLEIDDDEWYFSD